MLDQLLQSYLVTGSFHFRAAFWTRCFFVFETTAHAIIVHPAGKAVRARDHETALTTICARLSQHSLSLIVAQCDKNAKNGYDIYWEWEYY